MRRMYFLENELNPDSFPEMEIIEEIEPAAATSV
jgi:hypothetical protein